MGARVAAVYTLELALDAVRSYLGVFAELGRTPPGFAWRATFSKFSSPMNVMKSAFWLELFCIHKHDAESEPERAVKGDGSGKVYERISFIYACLLSRGRVLVAMLYAMFACNSMCALVFGEVML